MYIINKNTNNVVSSISSIDDTILTKYNPNNHYLISDTHIEALRNLKVAVGTYTDELGVEQTKYITYKGVQELQTELIEGQDVWRQVTAVILKPNQTELANIAASAYLSEQEFANFKHKLILHDHVEALKWKLYYKKTVPVWNATFTSYSLEEVTTNVQPFNIYSIHILDALEALGKAKVLKRVEHALGNDKVRVELHVGINDINVSAWNAMSTATYIDENGAEQLLMTHIPNPYTY